MTYLIRIGQMQRLQQGEEGYTPRTNYLQVRVVINEDAPDYESNVPAKYKKSNRRCYNRTAWNYFCEAAGIDKVFLNTSGELICGHPGSLPITQEMFDTVKEALTIKLKNDLLPQINQVNPSSSDIIKAQLIWLVYWMTWARTHCKEPVIRFE